MNKTLAFDMDGTIADLYGVSGWLNDLMNENTRPYDDAAPLYDMDILNGVIISLKAKGWKIVITSWLAKGSSKAYDNKVRTAKLAWLKKTNFPYDEVHLVKYGTTKANCTRKHGGFQILVDDNATVRKGWHLGATIDANNDIIASLMALD